MVGNGDAGDGGGLEGGQLIEGVLIAVVSGGAASRCSYKQDRRIPFHLPRRCPILL